VLASDLGDAHRSFGLEVSRSISEPAGHVLEDILAQVCSAPFERHDQRPRSALAQQCLVARIGRARFRFSNVKHLVEDLLRPVSGVVLRIDSTAAVSQLRTEEVEGFPPWPLVRERGFLECFSPLPAPSQHFVEFLQRLWCRRASRSVPDVLRRRSMSTQ